MRRTRPRANEKTRLGCVFSMSTTTPPHNPRKNTHMLPPRAAAVGAAAAGGGAARPCPPLPRLRDAPPLTLTLDRTSAARGDAAVVTALASHPGATTVIVHAGRVLVVEGGQSAARLGVDPAAVTRDPPLILLGCSTADGAPLFATAVPDADAAAAAAAAAGPGAEWVALRDAAPRLARDDCAALAVGAALASWHEGARFDPATGSPTVPVAGGYARQVVSDGDDASPPPTRRHRARRVRRRLDPAVLVLATCGSSVLLGRKPDWPDARYSLLAGFVDAGESIEQAAARELQEEAGVVAADDTSPTYWGSQPWPFSGSLMLAVGLEVETGRDGRPPHAKPLDGELADVRWFDADTVAAATRDDSETLQLPGPHALARSVLARWVASV